MASVTLRFENVPIAFKQGLDTKTDPKQVVPGKLLLLENAHFDSLGQLSKRNGYAELGTALGAGIGLASFEDSLLAFDGANAWQRDTITAAWSKVQMPATAGGVPSGMAVPYPAIAPTRKAAVRSSFTQTVPCVAYAPNGAQCTTYQQNVFYPSAPSLAPAVFVCVRDSAGADIIQPMMIERGTAPRCIAFGTDFVLFWHQAASANLRMLVISSLAPAVTTSGSTVAADVDAACDCVDACVITHSGVTRLFVSYSANVTATLSVKVFYLSTSYVQSSPASVYSGIPDPDVCHCIFEDYTDGQLVCAISSTTTLYYSIRSFDLGTVTIITSLGAHPATNISGIAGTFGATYSASGRTFVFTEAGSYKLSTLDVTSGGAANYRPIEAGIGLASKPFLVGTGVYCLVQYDSATQATFFLASLVGAYTYLQAIAVVAKYCVGTAGTKTTAIVPPVQVVTNIARIPVTEKDLISASGGKIFSQTGISILSADFSGAPVSSLEYGNNLLLSGGVLSMWDGQTLAELGFHTFPELSVPNPGTTHVYQYSACWAWTDAKGQVHRSAPSVPVTHGQAYPIDGSHTCVVTLLYPPITAKQGVVLEIYRTIDAGSIFYRTNGIPSGPAPYTDSTTDAVLIGNDRLYTTGGVIEDIGPGPLTGLCVHDSRVFGISQLDPTVLQYTKQIVPGYPPEFSDLLTMAIDGQGGGVVAIAELDDKLVAFKSDRIFVVTGSGPDDTGAQNGFSPSIPLPHQVGCTAPKSVVTTPNGLMFRSRKGIYLLDRSLNVSYVGADVESWNTYTVTRALSVPLQHQVRFNTNHGETLVFDYLVSQWSVYQGVAAADAVISSATYTYITAAGSVRQETAAYADLTADIPLRVRTSWLALAGLSGYQRARRVMLLGDWLSAHSLTVTVEYDYDTAGAHTISIDASTSATAAYEHRIDLARQKCEAIRLTITEVPTGTARGLTLSSMTINVGLKQGLNKKPAPKVFGG